MLEPFKWFYMDKLSTICDQLGDAEFSQSRQISETQKMLGQIHYWYMAIEFHDTALLYAC